LKKVNERTGDELDSSTAVVDIERIRQDGNDTLDDVTQPLDRDDVAESSETFRDGVADDGETASSGEGESGKQ
jgi:hypothetical protein